jgi:ethanolamine-phosphate cytidylyltransferase
LCPAPKCGTLIAGSGHAGAMLQARQLGNELLVGIHSDEAILENKGPTVMTLEER